ncbi:MAG TPA: hypothetical protein VF062_23815 [Candidatus Limnocylindrales bacterium]
MSGRFLADGCLALPLLVFEDLLLALECATDTYHRDNRQIRWRLVLRRLRPEPCSRAECSWRRRGRAGSYRVV